MVSGSVPSQRPVSRAEGQLTWGLGQGRRWRGPRLPQRLAAHLGVALGAQGPGPPWWGSEPALRMVCTFQPAVGTPGQGRPGWGTAGLQSPGYDLALDSFSVTDV